MRLVLFMR